MQYFSLSPPDRCLCESFFFLYCRCFFVSFLPSPNDAEVCFIKYDALDVPHFGPFSETVFNALRESLFSVLLWLVLILLITLPPCSGHKLPTGIIYAAVAIGVIVGYSSMSLVPQIFFKNQSATSISVFNLFRDRFYFNQ